MSESRFSRLVRCVPAVLCCLSLLFSAGAAQALEKATLQLKWLHHFQFAGYYAALEKGLYRKAGLDVTILEGGPATEVEKEVVSGRVDFGVGTSALLLHRAQGDDLVVLGQIFQHSPAIFLTPRKTGIHSISDMAGRRFMYSNQHGDMLALLRKNGVDEASITSVPHAGDPHDLISGKADVMMAYSFNEPFVLEQVGEPYLVFSPATYGIDFYGDNFFTTRRLIDSRPEFVRAFREATLAGWRYALANKAEIVDLILSRYSRGKNRDWLLFEANQIDSLVQPTLVELGYQSDSRWKHISEIFSGLGMLPPGFDPAGIIYNPEPPDNYRILVGVILVSGSIIAVLAVLVLLFRRLNRRLSMEMAERKLAEDALRANEGFLQTIIDSEPECVKIIDRDGKLTYMNPAGLAMIEAESLDQVRGTSVYQLIPAETQEDVRRIIAGVFEGKEGYLKFEMIGFKGRHLWLDAHAVPLRNQQGEIDSLLGITRDITHRWLAEQALQKHEKDLQTILDMMPVGIALTDGVNIQYINNNFRERFGYTIEEIPTDQRWFQLAYPDPLYRNSLISTWKNDLDEARRTGNPMPMIEVKVVCKDGTVRHAIANTKLIQNRILIIFTDITERELLHNQQLKIEKLESLGVLAGGIAHDFNNILTGIMGNISFAEMLLDPAHRAHKPLAASSAASLRAAELANQLLTFARGGQPVKQTVRIERLVNESLTLVLSGSKVKGVVEIPASLYNVEADAGQLNQVINNLAINAEQAMPGGGILAIRAENRTLKSNNSFSLPPGEYVEISVTDQGCGIPAEDIDRIFDPYFSTKSGGTGLGLASAYSIVRKHGGQISVSSRVGRGTTFQILLPASRKSAPETEPDLQALVTGEHGGGSLLIMDDEDLIRNLAGAMLEELGYRVRTCVNGEEAIALYRAAREAGAPYSAVIMDLTIPGGMGGREAAERILAFDPTARLIVSSGYSNDPVMADHARFGFCASIEKPYRAADLGRVLREVLALIPRQELSAPKT